MRRTGVRLFSRGPQPAPTVSPVTRVTDRLLVYNVYNLITSLLTRQTHLHSTVVYHINLLLSFFLRLSHASLVQSCVLSWGVKVAARSGGHSYAANGIGGEDGSLVIDLKILIA